MDESGPGRWIDLDGAIHTERDCKACGPPYTGQRCRSCGKQLHSQPVYGGIAYACPCEGDWNAGPAPDADSCGLPMPAATSGGGR